MPSGSPSPSPTPAPGAVSLSVLSNRADLISGGDALVEVILSGAASPEALVVTLNGEDVSEAFALRENGRVMGLVEGLALGENTLTARVGSQSDSLVIRNHPNGGPVFSGPRPEPWTCGNAAVAVDADCNQPPEYRFLYKSSRADRPGLLPYDPENPASDVAMTTTQTGVRVPFIVREELGYQLRDQYRIYTLFDPASDWAPWAPQPQWNGKILFTHGGSCGVTYRSGTPRFDDYAGTIPPNPVIEQSYIEALGLGFAVGATALNNTGHNCNHVVIAESMMMLKERFIEAYGPLRYSIGTGCSGGSIAQQMVANTYPGIYDGLIVTCSYPDVYTTAVQFADYHLLRQYFENPSRWGPGIVWTPQQMADVYGHISIANAIAADEAFFKSATNPSNPECRGLPADRLYHPTSRPDGVRCGVIDYMINVLGPRLPEDWSPIEQALGRGFAGLPLGNVGVQYGRQALLDGKITPAQFVDLNVRVGGLDIDIQRQAERTAANEPALSNVYRTGGVNLFTHLDRVPIIDGSGPDPGIAHDSVHTYAGRDRLVATHGHHENQAIWEGPVPLIGDTRFALTALDAMDRWLAAIEADLSDRSLPEKVRANRPADVGDACFDGNGNKLLDQLCGEAVVPIYGTPRTVSGESRRTDIQQCQLRPFTRQEYGLIGLLFTEAQWTALEQVFSDGVCDYSKPGQSQQHAIAWLTYQDAEGAVIHGGQALPPAPPRSGTGWASPAFRPFMLD